MSSQGFCIYYSKWLDAALADWIRASLACVLWISSYEKVLSCKNGILLRCTKFVHLATHLINWCSLKPSWQGAVPLLGIINDPISQPSPPSEIVILLISRISQAHEAFYLFACCCCFASFFVLVCLFLFCSSVLEIKPRSSCTTDLQPQYVFILKLRLSWVSQDGSKLQVLMPQPPKQLSP